MRALPPALALALSTAPSLLAVSPTAAPADAVLTGIWRVVAAPGAKGRPADLGELKVDGAGSYQWSENRQLAGLGSLQAYRPSGGIRAGQDCWLFHRGKGDLYAFREGNALEVYDTASNTLVGKGSKTGAKSR
ncbi:MAG TPA: hypothetical protein VFF76_02725 [Holophagaceae bacterium]|jgi:hypothetical protein|nr:hypothetical protein [Holophagaceae bacterium]